MQIIDLTNKQFGKLTALNISGKTKYRALIWKCKCSCGTIIEVTGNHLKQGHSTSCGCSRINNPKIKQNLLGQKFNKLTVIDIVPSKNERTYWKCQCDCGKIKIIESYSLTSGNTQSCGCSRYKGINELSLSFFCQIKKGAEKRNLPFNINIKEIWDLYIKQDKKCALTGIELKFKSKKDEQLFKRIE